MAGGSPMSPLSGRLARYVAGVRNGLSRDDLGGALVIALGAAAVGMAGGWIGPAAGRWLALVTALVAGLTMQLAVLRGMREQARRSEAILALTMALKPEVPLPVFSGWAVHPTLARLLVTTVFEQRPGMIVECGSGISTLVFAYAVRTLGHGSVVSLEHDPVYAEQTRSWLRVHGVSAWAQVLTVPLVPHRLNGHQWRWYDLTTVQFPAPIDLLFVDGPPGGLQRLSRYPAGPLLAQRLANEAIMILDDVHRFDERAIVSRWAVELGWRVIGSSSDHSAAVLMRTAGLVSGQGLGQVTS